MPQQSKKNVLWQVYQTTESEILVSQASILKSRLHDMKEGTCIISQKAKSLVLYQT
jgi:hypothetical protein